MRGLPTRESSPTVLVSAIACTDHDLDQQCRYQVAWSINPHMAIGSVEFASAARQHAAYKRALAAAGAEVIELPFVHGAYDSVFSKDTALLLRRRGQRRALLARPRFPERQREQTARRDLLEHHGFDVVCDPSGPSWEGGDLVMLPSGRGMFLGHGLRSGPSAARWLERSAGLPVVTLELRDPLLYHLDMALAVLPDGTALVCEAALTDDSMHRLERAQGITQVITVPRADAIAFGLNFVTIGRTVVLGSRASSVAQIIRSRGYVVKVVALDQFHLAGGSAACLVAMLHPDPEPPARPLVMQAGGSMEIYGPVFRSVLYPLWEAGVRKRPILDRWRDLNRTQWLSHDELRAMQDRSLRELISHAYHHVPFYRGQMEAVGLRPDDIRTGEDLLKLPVVRRADLQHARQRESTAVPVTIRKQTSGTTGEPLVFGFEHDSEHWRCAVKLRGYEWAGHRPGDRAVHFWGAPLPTPPPWHTRTKIKLDRYLRRDIYIPCAVMSDEHLQHVVDVIARAKPRVLVCYAQAGGELARYINRNNLRTWRTLPVICGAERLLPSDRADLEEAFGPSVFDTYGCREVMMIAAECEAHDGMHVSMENLVVEILVTENGTQRRAREGETGEVVFTDLHNRAMPFIRYANGDIATAGPDRRCPCGRGLERIKSIEGRSSETLRDANGAPINGLALSFLFHDITAKVRQFRATQHKDRSVTISLVAAEYLPETILQQIRQNGARLLSGVDVRVNVVPELPRSPAGKHKLVVVER